MAALIACAATVFVVTVARVSVYRIGSGSMEPDFPVGSLVVDSAAVPLAIGRAVTFTAEGGVVTHVLTGYNADGSLATRGTANRTADAWDTPVYPKDVRARVLFDLPFFAPSFWTGTRLLVTSVAVGTFALAGVLWVYARRVK